MRPFGKFLYCGCTIVWLLIGLNLIAKPAYAYVDPGSGLFLTQILGSMTVGFTFLVRKRLRRLFGFISKLRNRAEVKDLGQV